MRRLLERAVRYRELSLGGGACLGRARAGGRARPGFELRLERNRNPGAQPQTAAALSGSDRIMTRLFEYLVERSVRASSHAAARRDLEAPPAAHTSGDQAQSALDAARGSLTPRRRIRYERGPSPEHWSGETIALAGETLPSHSTDERLRLPEKHDSFRDAEQTIGAAKARSRIELTLPRAAPVAPAASAANWPEPPNKETGRRADPPLLRTDPSAERAATAQI